MNSSSAGTASSEYTTRLSALEGAWWKRILDVQAPYRLHLKGLKLGKVLDLGCGIGRNLYFLDRRSIGVDHNPHSVEVACRRGCRAMLPDEFFDSEHAQTRSFDTLLIAHVLEHLSLVEGRELLQRYIEFLKPGARIVVITPQEAGYRSDSTHVRFVDHGGVGELFDEISVGTGVIALASRYSFPFPRACGKFFKYNEFVTIGKIAGVSV